MERLLYQCGLLDNLVAAESGAITEIKVGDSWIFPNGWKGTAEVIETVRKVYMIVS